jgi:hypothetical protein
MIAHLKPWVIDLKARQGNKAEDMKDNSKYTCSKCGEIDYGKFPHCKCEREYEKEMKEYHRERLNPEGANKLPADGILDPDWTVNLVSTCDSPNSEYKENPRDMQK